MSVAWSAAELATLRRMHAARQSARAIAAALPGRSRAAVLGRLHRLGLALETSHLPPRWTAAEDAILVRMRRQGATIATMAAALPKRTAAAVKSHMQERRRADPVSIRAASADRRCAPPRLRTTLIYVPDPGPCAHLFLDVPPGGCRWPAGDGRAMRFCGVPQAKGSAYCAHHFFRSVRDGVTGSAA